MILVAELVRIAELEPCETPNCGQLLRATNWPPLLSHTDPTRLLLHPAPFPPRKPGPPRLGLPAVPRGRHYTILPLGYSREQAEPRIWKRDAPSPAGYRLSNGFLLRQPVFKKRRTLQRISLVRMRVDRTSFQHLRPNALPSQKGPWKPWRSFLLPLP